MVVVGAVYGLAMVLGRAPLPGDAANYWHPVYGHYVYPPPLEQAIWPLRVLGAWQVFVVAWMALCFGSLGYLLGRWSLVAVLMAVPAVYVASGTPWTGPIESVLVGNVTLPMVAAIVLGMRQPAFWAVPLLTKMTAGVGVLWFAFRGEWRSFGVAIGATIAIAAASFVLAPDTWAAFTTFALDHLGATSNGPEIVGPGLWIRLPAAVLLIAWGARTDRAWVVPIACAMAVIGLYGWATFGSVAVGAWALRPGQWSSSG